MAIINWNDTGNDPVTGEPSGAPGGWPSQGVHPTAPAPPGQQWVQDANGGWILVGIPGAQGLTPTGVGSPTAGPGPATGYAGGPTPGGATPPPGGGGGGNAGPNALSGLFDPLNLQPPDASLGQWNLPTLPRFQPPGYDKPPAFSFRDYQAPAPFTAPSWESVQNEPGFMGRVALGNQAIQNSAAAHGTLLGGNTLKGLADYNQNQASNEYGNVYGRDLGTYQTNVNNAMNAYGTSRQNALENYNTNYRTQYVDPYQFAYRAALDEFSPLMTQYTTQANQNQAMAQNLFNNQQTRWQDLYNQAVGNRLFKYNAANDLANRGLTGAGA